MYKSTTNVISFFEDENEDNASRKAQKVQLDHCRKRGLHADQVDADDQVGKAYCSQ